MTNDSEILEHTVTLVTALIAAGEVSFSPHDRQLAIADPIQEVADALQWSFRDRPEPVIPEGCKVEICKPFGRF